MEKKSKKILYIIMAFIVVAAIISLAISYKTMIADSSTVTYSDDYDTTTITFTSSWAGTDTKSRSLKKIIEKFEEDNPHIKVINKSISGDDFLFTLKTDFAQGNEPDIFGIWPGSDIRNLIAAGKVADLTEIINSDSKWKASFGNDAWNYDMVDGKIYGIPCEIIYEGLFINRDLFNKYNVKVPYTYDDLKKAVEVFRENGIIPISYNSTPEGTYIYQNIVAKLGGKINTENPISDGRFNECYIKGMYYMKELYEMGAFPDDAFTLDNKRRDELFINKEAAMIVQGSWFIGEGSLDGNDSTVEMVPFPSFDDGKAAVNAMIYGVGNGNFHMSLKAYKDVKKRDAAIKFLKYLTSVDSAKILNSSSGLISNIKIPYEELVTTTINLTAKRLINYSDELIGPTDSFVDRNKWEKILVPNFPKMLEGKISPEDIFDMMGDE